MLARQELVENETERVKIAALVDRLHSESGFGRHIGDRAQHDSGLRQELLGPGGLVGGWRDARHFGESKFGEPKIDELDEIAGSLDENDVGRLHVAMHDADFVGSSETRRQLPTKSASCIAT